VSRPPARTAWGGDLREAVARVVVEEGVDEAQYILGSLVREASTSSMNWSTVTSLCARRVDRGRSLEGAFARSGLDQPADELNPRRA
jgi:hypothetical protein